MGSNEIDLSEDSEDWRNLLQEMSHFLTPSEEPTTPTTTEQKKVESSILRNYQRFRKGDR
jgi:hypothetical protein